MVVERLHSATTERGRGREPVVPAAIPGGYSDPFLQPRRLGQATSSALVTDAYRRRCAITEERALPALEAAHIRPFRDVQEHVLSNGIPCARTSTSCSMPAT